MSNFVQEKTAFIKNDPNHMVLICGDFNINSLEDTEESKQYVLSYNERNIDFLKASEEEYKMMLQIFENEKPGSVVDLVKE